MPPGHSVARIMLAAVILLLLTIVVAQAIHYGLAHQHNWLDNLKAVIDP